jgi:hypothetical protein
MNTEITRKITDKGKRQWIYVCVFLFGVAIGSVVTYAAVGTNKRCCLGSSCDCHPPLLPCWVHNETKTDPCPKECCPSN